MPFSHDRAFFFYIGIISMCQLGTEGQVIT